jgi:hypothetical protein
VGGAVPRELPFGATAMAGKNWYAFPPSSLTFTGAENVEPFSVDTT